MELRTQTIPMNDGKATVIVRQGRGMDIPDSSYVFGCLSYDRKSNRELNRAQNFVDTFLRSEVTGDLGFAWAGVDDSENIQATYEGWLTLSRDDLAKWKVALIKANQDTPGEGE